MGSVTAAAESAMSVMSDAMSDDCDDDPDEEHDDHDEEWDGGGGGGGDVSRRTSRDIMLNESRCVSSSWNRASRRLAIEDMVTGEKMNRDFGRTESE